MNLSRDICRSTPRFITQEYFAVAILLSATPDSVFAAGGTGKPNSNLGFRRKIAHIQSLPT